MVSSRVPSPQKIAEDCVMSQNNVCVGGYSALHLFLSTYSLCGLFDRLSIACLFLFWETSCITVDGMLAAGEHDAK